MKINNPGLKRKRRHFRQRGQTEGWDILVWPTVAQGVWGESGRGMTF